MIDVMNKNKLSTGDFIKKATLIWGNLYNYSLTVYINFFTKVKIICKIHGEFFQLCSNHYKYGCAKCKKTNEYKKLLKNKYSLSFVEKSNKVHNNKYTYEKSNYINAITKVIVTCKNHGEFEIIPNNHLCGKGCRLCADEGKSIRSSIKFEDYLPKMINVWGNTYNYSNINWKGSSNYIKLLCSKHGEFNILPYNHIKGKGCQKCFNRYSKISIQWLNYLQIKYDIFIQHADNIGEFSIMDTRLKADGYCKETNTIYEFLGDFWHGNPEIYDLLDINPRKNMTYLELYNETNDKKEKILKLGYNYIEIWENDWKKFIKTVINIQKIKHYY